MFGSRFKIWKQDPWVPHLGTRLTYLHEPVGPGPSDNYFQVSMQGAAEVFENQDVEPPRSRNGDFIFCERHERAQFLASHTFAVARQVLGMYLRSLTRCGYRPTFQWSWGEEPLTLLPFIEADGISPPGFRSTSKSMIFFHFEADFITPQDPCKRYRRTRSKRGRVFTCESFDFIAHETGHAVLEAINPIFKTREEDGKSLLELRDSIQALDEGFADLAAIFTTLGQMDQVEAIIAASRADPARVGFVSEVAERFGELERQADGLAATPLVDDGEFRLRGLRSANNSLRVGDLGGTAGPHERSQVLSGAVFDILLATFERNLSLYQLDPAETLFQAGRHVMDLVVHSFLDAGTTATSLAAIGSRLLAFEDDRVLRSRIQRILEFRRIFETHFTDLAAAHLSRETPKEPST